MAEGGLSFHPSSSELRQVLRHQASCPAHLVRKTPKGPLSFPLGAGIQMVSVRKLIFLVSIWRMSNMCSSSQSQAAIPMPSCPCPPESPKAVSSLGDALPVSSSYKCIQNHCFTGIMAISYISRLWLYYHIYPNLWRWSPWFWPFITVPKSIPKPGPSRFGRRRSRLLELHFSSSYWVAARRRRSALSFSTCWKELVAIWAVFNSLADD